MIQILFFSAPTKFVHIWLWRGHSTTFACYGFWSRGSPGTLSPSLVVVGTRSAIVVFNVPQLEGNSKSRDSTSLLYRMALDLTNILAGWSVLVLNTLWVVVHWESALRHDFRQNLVNRNADGQLYLWNMELMFLKLLVLHLNLLKSQFGRLWCYTHHCLLWYFAFKTENASEAQTVVLCEDQESSEIFLATLEGLRLYIPQSIRYLEL